MKQRIFDLGIINEARETFPDLPVVQALDEFQQVLHADIMAMPGNSGDEITPMVEKYRKAKETYISYRNSPEAERITICEMNHA